MVSCCWESLRGVTSALLRRNIPDPGRMLSNVVEAVREMHALGRGRVLLHRYAGPPFPGRPDRPPRGSAAAIRAHIVQFVLGTVRTETAFVGANPRFR